MAIWSNSCTGQQFMDKLVNGKVSLYLITQLNKNEKTRL